MIMSRNSFYSLEISFGGFSIIYGCVYCSQTALMLKVY